MLIPCHGHWSCLEALETGETAQGLVLISQGKASHRKHTDNPPSTGPYNQLFENHQFGDFISYKSYIERRGWKVKYTWFSHTCQVSQDSTTWIIFFLFMNRIYILKASHWSPIHMSNPDNRCANEYAKQSLETHLLLHFVPLAITVHLLIAHTFLQWLSPF